MPMFVKMGLNGTGYLGKQETATRAFRRFIARRKVLPGYPIGMPFESIKDVREYLSGDRIICLLCGKSFKRLGGHLQKIHGITEDQYREKYKIPWTYGLCAAETKKKYQQAMERRVEKGYEYPAKKGEAFMDMIHAPIRKCPFKAEIAIKNLEKVNNEITKNQS